MKQPIDRLLDAVDWRPLPPPTGAETPGLPVATREGTLEIGGHALRCYQLDNGKRACVAEDVHRFFGIPYEPPGCGPLTPEERAELARGADARSAEYRREAAEDREKLRRMLEE